MSQGEDGTQILTRLIIKTVNMLARSCVLKKDMQHRL